MIRRIAFGLLTLLALAALVVAARIGVEMRGETSPTASSADAAPDAPAQVERGRYLALAGHCAGCHTAAGG
ncbi:MAG: cytochrome c, partial [Variovorax sp.]